MLFKPFYIYHPPGMALEKDIKFVLWMPKVWVKYFVTYHSYRTHIHINNIEVDVFLGEMHLLNVLVSNYGWDKQIKNISIWIHVNLNLKTISYWLFECFKVFLWQFQVEYKKI